MNNIYHTIHHLVSTGVDNIISMTQTGLGLMPQLGSRIWSVITTKVTDWSSATINTCVIFAFFGLSKMWNYGLMITGRYLYSIKTKFPVAYFTCQSWIQWVYNCTKCIYSTIYKYRIEPGEPIWINSSSIELVYPNINTTKYKYCETYEYMQPIMAENQETPIQRFYTMVCLSITKNFIQDNTVIDNKHITQLFILKMDNKYLYRIKSIKQLADSQLTVSKMHFLSIVYTHPKMEQPIHMEIPKTALLQGNEILSSIFILRYLEYQPCPFVFDLNYTINGIDNHINQFTLKCHQYILLEENEYKVLSV